MTPISTKRQRPAITAAMKLEVLRRYAKVQCARCKNDFIPSGVFIQYDHVIPLGLGGRHIWENLQPLCKPCHVLKTDGPAHLKVDGDKSKIAKAVRLSRGGKKSKTPFPKRSEPQKQANRERRKELRAKLKLEGRI